VTTRDAILAAVRANQPPLAPPIPAIPLFERTSQLLLEQFQETLMSMGGKFVPAHDEENLDALVRSRSRFHSAMSVFDPFRTFGLEIAAAKRL